MKKFVAIFLLFSVFSFCGQNDEEVFKQEQCNRVNDEVNRIINFWKSYEQEIFYSEEGLWESYRDDMFSVQQELFWLIESCEDMFFGYDLENKRERIIQDIGYMEGYWQAKSES